MSTTTKQLTCKERIEEHLKSRLEDVQEILDAEDQIETLNNLALCYEDDPHYKAKKLELSYGGPSDGFRFFEDGIIQYYFMDWFDGSTVNLTGSGLELLNSLFESCLNLE